MLKKVEQILFFLTTLLLPTQLGRHFWPQFSYIYSLRIDYLSPTIYLWDVLVTGLILIFLIRGKRVNKMALILILLFLFSQAISLIPHLSNPDILGAGLTRLEDYIFSSFFGLYLASLDFPYLKKVIFMPLVLSVLGESVLAITQFLKGGTAGLWILGERTFNLSTPGIAKFDLYGRIFLRPYATFPHPNVLAAFLVVAISLIFFLWEERQDREKNLAKMTGVLGAFTILLTVSRVAILAGFISTFVRFGRNGRVMLLMGLLVLSPILYARYSSALNFDSLSLLRREELSGAAIKLWLESPFFGVGLNNFIPKAATTLLVGPSRFLQPAHNIYLLSLAETGLIGLWGLLGWLGYPIVRLFRRGQLLLIWGALLFLGLFDHYFLTLAQGYRLLFFLWGISLSYLGNSPVLE